MNVIRYLINILAKIFKEEGIVNMKFLYINIQEVFPFCWSMVCDLLSVTWYHMRCIAPGSALFGEARYKFQNHNRTENNLHKDSKCMVLD